jgi:hypothetical protein
VHWIFHPSIHVEQIKKQNWTKIFVHHRELDIDRNQKSAEYTSIHYKMDMPDSEERDKKNALSWLEIR